MPGCSILGADRPDVDDCSLAPGADPLLRGIAADKEGVGEIELHRFPENIARRLVEWQPFLRGCAAYNIGHAIDRADQFECARYDLFAFCNIIEIGDNGVDRAARGANFRSYPGDGFLVLVECHKGGTGSSKLAAGCSANPAFVDAAYKDGLASEVYR